MRALQSINSLFGTIVSLLVLVGLGAGGWFVYQEFFREKWETDRTLKAKEAQIEQLLEKAAADQEQIAKLQEDNDRLDTALRLLKIDHRVAQIDVVSQRGSATDGDLATQFTFVELDNENKPLGEPRLFSIEGDLVYVDSWVVKFTDEYVEMGDPLRSTSVCLFRRLFGETQPPSDGFLLDAVGSQPAAYSKGGKMSELEQEIWSRFWEYANDPTLAKKAGVRAAHGEAPFQKLVPGKRYKVLLRASGGLTFTPEDLPPAAKPGKPAETL